MWVYDSHMIFSFMEYVYHTIWMLVSLLREIFTIYWPVVVWLKLSVVELTALHSMKFFGR